MSWSYPCTWIDGWGTRRHRTRDRTKWSRRGSRFLTHPRVNFSGKQITVKIDFHGIQLDLAQVRLWKIKINFLFTLYSRLRSLTWNTFVCFLKNKRVLLKITLLNPPINKGKRKIKLRILKEIMSLQENNVFLFIVFHFNLP